MLINPSVLVAIGTFGLAFILGTFLFFRAGRHEYLESELLFDVMVFSFLGTLVGARIVDFVIRADVYQWNLFRLIFFNAYSGFNSWGGLAGGMVAGFLFGVWRKFDFWQIFDLAVAPLSFSVSVVFLGNTLKSWLEGKEYLPSLYYFLVYFLIFWILLRLAQRKRHVGFFVCFFLVFGSLLYLLIWVSMGNWRGSFQKPDYNAIFNLAFLILGAVFWYRIAKRSITLDVRSFFGWFLLVIFRTKRVLTSVDEAGTISRSLVIAPLALFSGAFNLLKLIVAELGDSFINLWGAFKSKK